jgi:nitroimidazol reductase NimA-like FMN-containing flavoprotein (pyridoxamine 5'-phosphate oxidase superfamily)
MSDPAKPTFRTLGPEECTAVLARNHVGRLAYVWANQLYIEPLHYVYADGWIYGRTSPGSKLDATGETWAPVAFEVDEVEELFRWRSVVVRGGFYTIPPDGAAWEAAAWRRGVELLRELVPGTLGADDPVPFRTVLFRIAVQEATGREATPGTAGETAA